MTLFSQFYSISLSVDGLIRHVSLFKAKHVLFNIIVEILETGETLNTHLISVRVFLNYFPLPSVIPRTHFFVLHYCCNFLIVFKNTY